jgi:hypothetical protein
MLLKLTATLFLFPTNATNPPFVDGAVLTIHALEELPLPLKNLVELLINLHDFKYS